MSVIGPRPQLVRDMVFMTSEQRMRHMYEDKFNIFKIIRLKKMVV